MLRRLATVGLVCVVATALLAGCGGSDGSAARPEFADVVGAAEAKTRNAESVTVTISERLAGDSTDASDFVAQWQAPDRVRFGDAEHGYSVFIANKMYSPDEGTPDRYRLMVPATRQADQGRISNFPAIWIGGIASRASAITFDGNEYIATLPVDGKTVTATMRIADGYIVWMRIVTPDAETIYELSEFNTSPPIAEPSPDNVDLIPNPPSCSTPTTAPSTSIAEGAIYFCMVDPTTR